MAKHEEKHEESLMEKIAEKIHVYDSSSSSLDSDDDKPSASLIKAKFCRLFGRERPVHLVFNGVKRALGVATVIWVLFEFAKEAKVFNAKPSIKFNLFKVCPMLLLVPTTGTRVVGTEDIGSPLIPGNTAMNSFLVNKNLRVHKLSERREMVGTEAAAMNDNINYKAFQCGNSPPNNPVGSNKGKKKVLISILLMLLLVLTTGIRGVGSEEIGSPLIPGNTAMNSLLINKNLRGHKLSERREMGGTEAAAMNDNINYNAFQRGNSPPNNPVGKQANPYKRSCNPGEYCRQGNKGKKKG